MTNFKLSSKHFDLIVIGSGGAGLMAAICAAKNGVKNIAIISKVVPTSSHTVAAKGGINAALGNSHNDDWRWHAFDTIKGSDYLADEDAVEILCQNAPQAIIELEKMGVVFSRDENGRIAQRAYGGQTINYGKGGLARRACYSKDKTGQTLLHTLYSQAQRLNIEFFSEFFVTDLLIKDKKCLGAIALNLNEGELYSFAANHTIIATGGYSQIYRNTTSSLICTGDGTALLFKENLPLMDMEFVQFHPSGIAGRGFLISEAARGEGAYLVNGLGERFMKNYSPQMMELASRDVISRAIAREIIEGRGAGANKDHILLDMRHLSDEILFGKLPGVVEIAKNFAKIDVKKDLLPIAPTAHYTMGGIPTNINCQVLDFENQIIDGMYAAGEAACVSVHGANRLGCNSLLDLIIFGQIAGNFIAKQNNNFNQNEFDKLAVSKITKLTKILQKNNSSSLTLGQIKAKLQNINEKYLGVFRAEKSIELALNELQSLFVEFQNYSLTNKNLIFNEELIAYFEIENLFLNSKATAYSALMRKESRGAHYCVDYPERDDDNWQKHSLVALDENGQLNYKTSPRRIL